METNSHRLEVYAINFLMASLASINNDKLFKLTYRSVAKIAEKLAKRDYYVRRIRWIRDLFDQGHPSLEITKKILKTLNPHHRKTIIQSYVSTNSWWEQINVRALLKSLEVTIRRDSWSLAQACVAT